MAFVVGELAAPISLDDKAFKKGLSEVQKAGQSAAEAVSHNFQEVGEKMTGIGKKMTAGITLPILGAGVAIMNTGMKFGTQMSKVQAISGATGDDLLKLRDISKEMGRETMFSATQSAEALEYMALAGWDTQQMLDGLPGVLDLAAAGALDLGQASDIVTDGMSMFQMEANEAGRMSDVLAKAQANASTNVQELGEAFKMGGATAAAAGHDIEQTSAILGIFANNGYKGSQAGTILDNMFRDLRESAEDGAIAVGDASIKVYDAEGNFRAVADIMADVEKATKDMTTEQRDQALASVFQSRSMRGVNAILGEGTDKLFDLEDSLYNSKGAAGEMAEIMQDNLGGSVTEMMSALEGLAISFYELGEGPIRDVVDWITSLIRKFIEMDDHTKQVIMIVAGLAAALGPLLLIAGALVSSIGALIPVFAALFSPVTLIIGAIAALTAGIIYLWNTNEQFKEIVMTVWEFISETISTIVGFLVEFVQERLDMLKEFWQENSEAIMEAVQNAFHIISTIITTVMNVILGIMEFIWPAIRALIVATWEAIKGVIDGALNFIMGLVNTFAGLLTGDFERMWDGIKQMFSGALQFVWNLINLWFVGRIMGVARNFVGLLRRALSNMWSFIRNLFTSSLNAVRSTVSSGLNAVRSVFTNIFNSLRGIVTGAFGRVTSAVKNGITRAWETVTGMFSRFKDAGKNIITSIADGIKGAVGKVTDAIGGVMDKVRGFLPFSPAEEGPLKDIHKLDFGGPISDSIKNALPEIDAALNTALSVPEMQQQPGASPTLGGSGFLERIISLLEKLANSEQVIVLDTGELVGGTYPEIDRVGSNQLELTERWGR